MNKSEYNDTDYTATETPYSSTMMDEMDKPKSNVLLGIIGAVGGALIGAILWVVIYQVGFIASIAGFVIVTCAYRGYVMLGKGGGMTAAIITLIISILTVFLAHCFCWALAVYTELGQYGYTIMDAIVDLPTFIFHPDLVFDFMKDLLIGYVLMIAGSYKFLGSAFRQRA